jgi:tetratricopeptide (TPR) repeat protein
MALGHKGYAYRELGHAEKAVDLYEQALAIDHETGDRRRQAYHSWNLGEMYEETDPARAVELMSFRVAYERESGHPRADTHAERVEQIRAQLADKE